MAKVEVIGMVQEIYVLRHAAPDRASGVPYNIVPGPPLTATGRQEALQAGRWLSGKAISIVYVSPFARTRQTASIVSEHLVAPFAYVDGIRESAPSEDHQSVRRRVHGFLESVHPHGHSSVLLVTHGCCVLATLQVTTNDTIDLTGHTYDYGNKSPTAGIWHGVAQQDGTYRWELVFRPSTQAQ
jgi:2,3-bisphosphoglycerate-dependent phosphoglycerate mutase